MPYLRSTVICKNQFSWYDRTPNKLPEEGQIMNIAPDAGFLTIAAAIFFVINATGQIPLFLAMLARFDQKRQIKIIVRELTVALAILLLFTFFGDDILKVLGITRSVIAVAGGVLLFLISLTMIFPKSVEENDGEKALKHEPMIIPLAIPVITGPGAITTVMLYAHEVGSSALVAGAVIAAWIPSLIILLLGSYIKQILGEKGLVAVERLGGMLVCLIGVQMLTNGIFSMVKEFFCISC
jgi:multiple antibiotic resistance protein